MLWNTHRGGRLVRLVVGCCLFTFALAALGHAQTGAMTNADVIELVEAGLGPTVLVAAIGRADTVDFDVDAGLLDLARSGVPDEVITAMIERQSAQDGQATVDTTAAGRAAPGIYLLQADGTEVRLEPTAYSAASASGWRARLTLGIAKDQARATIPRSRAMVRAGSSLPRFRFVFPAPADDSTAFQGGLRAQSRVSDDGSWWSLVGAQVANPNQFTLARLEAKEGRRELVVGQVNQFGLSTGPRGEDMREFRYEMLGPGVYEVTVTQSLAAGEFCFFPILAGNVTGEVGGAGFNQIFDFGVDP